MSRRHLMSLFELLEPYEGKLSRTVLRGGSGSDAADLLDKIFGQEVTKDLLIDFLNDLLVDEKSIKDITFLDKELLPEYGRPGSDL